MKFLDVLAVWIRNFYIESDNIKILPSGAFPDSNQSLLRQFDKTIGKEE
jgi:hypothetical protein